MRIALAALACVLVLAGSASAAIFVTPPYEGKTVPPEAGPFEWRFVSTYGSGEELGGVAFELNPGHVVVRCQGPSAVRLTEAQQGITYTIKISDDYSPQWLAEHGMSSTGGQCTGATPAGHNEQVDSLTVGPPDLPVPELTPTPFEDKQSPWTLEAAANAARAQEAEAQNEFDAREELAEFEARKAQEAHAQQPATTTPPKPCVVPALAGHSLASAERLLIAAHCRLGHVVKPRGRRGKLDVSRQTPARGLHLAAGAVVSVRLAVPRK
jgi:hypothetical protein